ncbi:MAG: YhjD/YihY/BrkB family envelope integrity protein, partial [Janthinobacterium lividum]
ATGKKGFGLILALLLAVYGAMKGAGAVVTALNVAYEVPDDRSFVKKTMINAGVTVGALVVAIVTLASGSLFAAFSRLTSGMPELVAVLINLVSWLVTGGIAVTATALLYRYEGDLLDGHPTPKSLNLVADLLLDCTARGETVLDPFLGSGTTLIAAEKTGRICFGLDLDPLYVDLAVRRWQAWTGEAAIDAISGERFADREAAAAADTAALLVAAA